MKKVAFITGITGQDGSYLMELLIEKGYIVHGLYRRSSVVNDERIKHISENPKYKDVFFGHYGDLTDASNLNRLIEEIQPDEIYNLGAQSHCAISFDMPEFTSETNAIGVLKLLEAIRHSKKKIKLYQASTSEMFGRIHTIPQSETTPFCPQNPYAVAKLYAYWMIRLYREAYGMFAVNGICFNHESPRRGVNFITRKITIGVAKLIQGKIDVLDLGNINSGRDWGYAKDYVEAMWLMMQQDTPKDYVISTGRSYTVRDFCEEAFKAVGIDLIWEGEGVNETGKDRKTGRILISINPKFYRPLDEGVLEGNYSLINKELGWKPKTSFKELVELMVKEDLKIKW